MPRDYEIEKLCKVCYKPETYEDQNSGNEFIRADDGKGSPDGYAHKKCAARVGIGVWQKY